MKNALRLFAVVDSFLGTSAAWLAVTTGQQVSIVVAYKSRGMDE